MDGLFVRLISQQPAVLFSQNKPATSNQLAVPKRTGWELFRNEDEEGGTPQTDPR
jgi:hypothetical protein